MLATTNYTDIPTKKSLNHGTYVVLIIINTF